LLTEILRLMRKARVTARGAVLLGETSTIDGHEQGRTIRVVTHIHSDHVLDLRRSIRECGMVVATPITHEMLRVLGYRIPPFKSVPVEYGNTLNIDGEKLTLLRSNHIPGTAQVLVETAEGDRLLYTSDFKLPGTPIVRDADVVVVDATYGYTEWMRPWQEEVEGLLVDIVKDALALGPVGIFGYHGKLQEVMLILRSYGIDAPFIAPRRVYQLTMVLKKHGYAIGDILLHGTREAREAMRDGWYIYFAHMRAKNHAPCKTKLILSGWEFREPFRRIGAGEWLVAFSDHADFRQLVNYIDEARPKLVIVDGYRGGRAAVEFAKYVRRRLGIPAITSPAPSL